MKIEQKLQSVDFSKFSKVEDSLLTKLLNKRRKPALNMDELDMVVAAGNTPVKVSEDNPVTK